jgi:predicted acylesterase/phospholipase RssA
VKPRIGLALSGGGAKGAFTVGVLKVIDQLLDPAPYPAISGTSTGSLVGTLLQHGWAVIAICRWWRARVPSVARHFRQRRRA